MTAGQAIALGEGAGYSLAVGSVFGRYQIVEPLARGGMAELFLAASEGLAGTKLVVIKKILPGLAADPQFREMFLQEVELASRLDHPNIVTVLDSGVVDGEYYFAMEYVHGVDLREFMRSERGPLPLEIALPILSGIALALSYAHEAVDEAGEALGLVHRDVSLTNVLLSYDGAVKLADFGIARASERTSVTRTGIRKGKIAYMSPEQAQGAPVDGRSDLFSLGVVAHEITTGKRLFRGASDVAVLHALTLGEIPPPGGEVEDYPQDLAALVMDALWRDVDQRIGSAKAFHRRLDEIARNRGISLSPSALAERLRARFGAPVLPSLTGIKSNRVELPTREVPGSQRIPYGWIAIVSTLIGSLAVVGYDAAARRGDARRLDAPVAAPVEDPTPQLPAAHQIESESSGAPVPEAQPVAEPAPELAPEPESEPESEREPEPRAKKKKRTPNKTKKKTKKVDAIPSGPKAPDVLYPPN